jgi:hypothetical protein
MNPSQSAKIAGFALVSAFGVATMMAITAFPGRADACRRPAPQGAYSIDVLVDGNPLSVYTAKGTTYVEALKGREYAVRLTNHTGQRVAVALAIDGLNSIDAQRTTAQDARKWILAPWETVTLNGWQTSSGTARRFVFTSESKSYGAWLGHTSDLGVISAAFFRERQREEAIVAAPSLNELDDQRSAEGAAGGLDAPRERADGAFKRQSKKDELAATGIGREVEHRVRQVEFEGEDTPASVLSMRYEYHDALVRLGVIPAGDDALARRERARGFVEPGFAPDPYRGRR